MRTTKSTVLRMAIFFVTNPLRGIKWIELNRSTHLPRGLALSNRRFDSCLSMGIDIENVYKLGSWTLNAMAFDLQEYHTFKSSRFKRGHYNLNLLVKSKLNSMSSEQSDVYQGLMRFERGHYNLDLLVKTKLNYFNLSP